MNTTSSRTQESFRFKKWDMIIIGFFILVSFMPALYITLTSTQPTGNEYIIVEKDGVEIFRHPLQSQDETNISFDFTHNGQDYQGTLILKDGQVRLDRLPEEIVPLAIHENMGFIERSHQVIVALPIRLLIRIHSEEPSDVDLST
ncbi:MAG TPA: hypothetical protein DEA52_03315 [Clostridiaceae bacterium]|nr:hypothetical protein [Clostridiaceae bacterium]